MNRLKKSNNTASSSSNIAKEVALAVTLPILVVFFFKFWSTSVNYFIGDTYNESPMKWIATQLVCIYLPLFVSFCFVISHWGPVRIWEIFSQNGPSFREFMKWAFIGMFINFPTFVNRFNHGFYFDSAGFLAFILIAALSYTLIYPFVEEVIFRGYCYSMLRKRGKWRAFLISTTLFVLAHISMADALSGQVSLTAIRVAHIVIVSAIATHIYESTGKLLLCITFHCAANFMADAGQLARYISSQF